MTQSDLPQYYDEMDRWNRGENDFSTYSGHDQNSVHRFLTDPVSGAFSPMTIFTLLDPWLPAERPLQGLDAGCGYGGACFRNHEVHGGHWTGVTIAPSQWQRATQQARARGLEASVEFLLQSYDAPLPGEYNTVIAIESLIHSPDPARTLQNLVAHMAKGARLMIVDDMPVSNLTAQDALLLEDFKKMWRCPVAPSAQIWTSLADAHGLTKIAEQDLSAMMRPRNEAQLDEALQGLRAQQAQKEEQGYGLLAEAEIGGVHLERLQQRGAIQYMLLVFEA